MLRQYHHRLELVFLVLYEKKIIFWPKLHEKYILNLAPGRYPLVLGGSDALKISQEFYPKSLRFL